MRKRLAGALALGVASALVLVGCADGGGGEGGGGGGEGGEDVDFAADPSGTLEAWAFNNADDVGQARLDYAAEQLAEVDIQLDATAFDAQKFTTRLASGDVPDIVQMDRPIVAQYAAQGLLMPLDQCFEAHEVVPTERWYEYVVDDVTWDDQVWATPQFYQPPAILLNMDVMDAAGVTEDQIDTSQPDVLLEAIEAMYAASGGTPTTLGFDPQVPDNARLWILGNGGQVQDEEGRPTLDDPANVAAVELMQQIIDAQGGFAAFKSFKDSFDAFGDNNQYVADQVGAQINAQWYPNVLSPYLDEIRLRAVPFRSSDGEPFSIAGGTSFAIPVGAQNPGAACAWMMAVTHLDAWIAAEEARVATLAENNGLNTGLFTGSPEADQLIREEYVQVEGTGNEDFDQVINTYYEVLDYGGNFGASPAGQTMNAELGGAVTSVLLGEKDVETAMADAQAASLQAYEDAVAGG